MVETGTSTQLHLPTRILTWTSVFTGWLVSLGFAWLFYVLGIAVGFSAFDVCNADAAGRGVGVGTAIWVALTWAVAVPGRNVCDVGRRSTRRERRHAPRGGGLGFGYRRHHLLAAMGFNHLAVNPSQHLWNSLARAVPR